MFLCCFDLGDGDFGQADVADFAVVAEVVEGTDLVLERNSEVDAVQVVEVDPVELQASQAHFDALAQVFGPPDRCLIGSVLVWSCHLWWQ